MNSHLVPHHGYDALHPALYWNGGRQRRQSWQTAIELLLPVAAAMFGLAAFGFVYYANVL
jgi:hypothetical protein